MRKGVAGLCRLYGMTDTAIFTEHSPEKMENNETVKPKRFRRTKKSIEAGILRGAVEEVEAYGFSDSMVTGIMRRAQIEPPVFYNRYKDLGEFFGEFVKGYDYWFSDIAEAAAREETSRKQYKTLLGGLLHSLKDRSVMLELLRWEVAQNNKTTRRTATLREEFTQPLTEKYEKLFADTDIDIAALSSLLIGGIYYLSLHRDASNFCGIDMTSDEGVERIARALEKVSDILFSLAGKEEE